MVSRRDASCSEELNRHIRLSPCQLRGEHSSSLFLLLAIAAVVPLIACANLANLLLARASRREREFAMRLALGASRRRLLSQLMVESALLVTAGAVFALIVSTLPSRYVVSFLRIGSNPVFLDVILCKLRVNNRPEITRINESVTYVVTRILRSRKCDVPRSSPSLFFRTSGREQEVTSSEQLCR